MATDLWITGDFLETDMINPKSEIVGSLDRRPVTDGQLVVSAERGGEPMLWFIGALVVAFSVGIAVGENGRESCVQVGHGRL